MTPTLSPPARPTGSRMLTLAMMTTDQSRPVTSQEPLLWRGLREVAR